MTSDAELPPEATAQVVADALARLEPVLPLLRDLGERFAADGHQLALVGGPVRDAFLGRDSLDLDLTTSARPEQIEPLLERWGSATWDMGRDFGTIGARRGETVVEVTTYRADEYDRTTRKPVVAFGDDLAGDLVRRDFTVNAMALRLPHLELVDPHGGMLDLAAGRLRTPSTPEVSFADDPLRMLRAARFVAQLGLTPAPEVVAAMTAAATSLEIVSAERVRDELVKLLLAPDPVAGLRLLVDTGLADQVLPELPALRLEIDEHHRHKDVYEHTLTVLEQAIALDHVRALLDDNRLLDPTLATALEGWQRTGDVDRSARVVVRDVDVEVALRPDTKLGWQPTLDFAPRACRMPAGLDGDPEACLHVPNAEAALADVQG